MSFAEAELISSDNCYSSLFFPQLLLVFQISSSLFSPLVPLQKFTCCPSSPYKSLFYCSSLLTLLFFNSPFLTLSFTLVWCPPSSSTFFPHFLCCFTKILLFTFHINIVLPCYCRSTRLWFFLQYSIVPFHDCIILFSQLCCLLFTIEVLTQCSCSFPKNSIVFFHKVLFFFDKAIVLLPIFYCLLSQCYCHNSVV